MTMYENDIENFYSDNNDKNNNVDNSEIIKVKLFYSGKEKQIEINKYNTIQDLKAKIISMLNINFTNYDLVYKLQSFPDSDNTIVLYQILSNDSNPSFILRKKEIQAQVKHYNTSVVLEHFPSFMDLSEQMKSFCNQFRNEIDFHLDYKSNWCKVSFVDAECAFSFVSFMTSVKWSNKLYSKVKINIVYDKPKNKNKELISQYTTSTKSTKQLETNALMHNKRSNYYKPIITESNRAANRKINGKYPYSDLIHSDYLHCSEPYNNYNNIQKQDEAYAKKNWINHKGFFTSVGKYSTQHMKNQRVKMYFNKHKYHNPILSKRA